MLTLIYQSLCRIQLTSSGWCGSPRSECISSLHSQVMWSLPRSAPCWLRRWLLIVQTHLCYMWHYWLNWSTWEAHSLIFFPIPQYRSLVFMAYGMLAVFSSMGWAYVMLILSHCLLLYSISLVKLRWLCFVAGLTTLATFKMEPFISWQACHWHCKNIKYTKKWNLNVYVINIIC